MTTPETYVEVQDEPRHFTVILNEYVRLIRVKFPAKDTTLYHRHSRDSFYIHLATAQLGNDVVGKSPCVLNLSFGGVAYGNHVESPFVHKITGLSEDSGWDCIDGELLATPPVVSSTPLQHDAFKMILESPRVRMYDATLEPGKAQEVVFPFYGVVTAMSDGAFVLERTGDDRGAVTHNVTKGDMVWIEPLEGRISCSGDAPLQIYLTEIYA